MRLSPGMDSVVFPDRFPLGLFPTPLVEARGFSKALGGPRVLIKRDDMTGFGFGGNKVRGLEFLIQDALERDADVVVTGAGPQSNHVRATAAAARVAGLDIVAVMHDSRPSVARGNLLLDELLGAELRFTDDPERGLVDVRIKEVAAELSAKGRRPYVIPRGGTSGRSALGYVCAVRELKLQLAQIGTEASRLYVTTGACGTHAGLLAGAKIFGASYFITGVTVSRPVGECRARVAEYATEAARLLRTPIEVDDSEVDVLGGFIGEGYGIPTTAGEEIQRLMARTEGLFLDPTYTAKTVAGLAAQVRDGLITSNETIVYLHTGGEPALFA